MNTRKCFRCKSILPLNQEFFYKDSARIHGLSYECKTCLSLRKKGKDRRTERWKNLNDDQKQKVRERQKRYAKTDKGRAISLSKAYKKIDKNKNHQNDIGQEYLLNVIFLSSCVYCGSTEKLGCDRVDNSIGHTIANCVPACGDCNIMRGDRFTYQEMLIIGKTIAHVRELRGT